MKKLSNSQTKILKFISEYTAQYGYPPTVREICTNVGLKSPSTVHSHLEKLKTNGYINRTEGKTRSAILTNQPPANSIPILGRVTAGNPILAVQEHTGYIAYQEKNAGTHFALTISGQSMTGVGIEDGDNVIIRTSCNPKNGDIVIAMLDDEATCKTLKLKSGKIWLMPENPAYEPIDGTNSHIIGVVVGLYRQY